MTVGTYYVALLEFIEERGVYFFINGHVVVSYILILKPFTPNLYRTQTATRRSWTHRSVPGRGLFLHTAGFLHVAAMATVR